LRELEKNGAKWRRIEAHVEFVCNLARGGSGRKSLQISKVFQRSNKNKDAAAREEKVLQALSIFSQRANH
jgi:hypothetical protein